MDIKTNRKVFFCLNLSHGSLTRVAWAQDEREGRVAAAQPVRTGQKGAAFNFLIFNWKGAIDRELKCAFSLFKIWIYVAFTLTLLRRCTVLTSKKVCVVLLFRLCLCCSFQQLVLHVEWTARAAGKKWRKSLK